MTSHHSHVAQRWKYYRTSLHHLLKKSKSPVYLYITLAPCVDPSWLLAGVNPASLSSPLQAGHMYRGALFPLHLLSSPPWGRDPGRAPGGQLGTEGKQPPPLLYPAKGRSGMGEGCSARSCLPGNRSVGEIMRSVPPLQPPFNSFFIFLCSWGSEEQSGAGCPPQHSLLWVYDT